MIKGEFAVLYSKKTENKKSEEKYVDFLLFYRIMIV
jgi:hypothetical protein